MQEDKPPTRSTQARWREMIANELYVIMIGTGTLTGTIAFFLIMTHFYPDLPIHWLWLALMAAGLLLPNVYKKLKHSEEPYLIRFARAFRVGFLSWSPLSFVGATWWLYFVEFWSETKRTSKGED